MFAALPVFIVKSPPVVSTLRLFLPSPATYSSSEFLTGEKPVINSPDTLSNSSVNPLSSGRQTIYTVYIDLFQIISITIVLEMYVRYNMFIQQGSLRRFRLLKGDCL